MKSGMTTAVMICALATTILFSGGTAAAHDRPHHGMDASMSGMMDQMSDGSAAPCMTTDAANAMPRMMMGSGMPGRMQHGMHGMEDRPMAHMRQMFYLDRADELGLSAEQVARLRAIHTACREENIRNAAEAQIARLELNDLLAQDDWSLEEAEKLVSRQQELEAKIQLRHLQSLHDARDVLTTEQRKQAGTTGNCFDPESLYR